VAEHGSRRVGVVPEVHGQERAFLERGRALERPERSLERLDDIAAAAYLGRLLRAEGAACDGADLERFSVAEEAGRKKLVRRAAFEGADDRHSQIAAGIDRGCRTMCRS